MGMYDTLIIKCPNCNTETHIQTKLGECMLDCYRLGQKTRLPDGIFRAKEGCHECNHYPTFIIFDSIFFGLIKNAPKNAKQEMPYGPVEDLGASPQEQIEKLANTMRMILDEIEDDK